MPKTCAVLPSKIICVTSMSQGSAGPPGLLGVVPPTQTTVPWATLLVSSQALTLIWVSEKGGSFGTSPCPWTDVCAVAIAGPRPNSIIAIAVILVILRVVFMIWFLFVLVFN